MEKPVVFVLASLLAFAAAQSVRTQNGTLLFQIGGATLALSGQESCAAGSGAGSTLATQADLTAAIANSIQQTQPQVLPTLLVDCDRDFCSCWYGDGGPLAAIVASSNLN